ETDPARRRAAIDEIFTEDCVFYEPRGVYRGRDEIDRVAGAIKATHPDFRLGQGEQASGGCNESLAPTEAVERHQHAIADLQVVDAPANGQHSPHPSFPTTLGSEGRTGYTPWMRCKSFMLIGACSTPISTWPAVGAGGSGRSASSRTMPGSPKVPIRTARILRLPCQ